MKDRLKAAIGIVAAELRAHRDLSQYELADKAGVDQSTIAHMESGNHMPRNSTWALIAPVLGVELHDIVRLAEERLGTRKKGREIAALDPDESELLSRFQRCSPEGRKLLLMQAEVFSKSHPKKP